jgi:hypothetical protein
MGTSFGAGSVLRACEPMAFCSRCGTPGRCRGRNRRGLASPCCLSDGATGEDHVRRWPKRRYTSGGHGVDGTLPHPGSGPEAM